MLVHDGFLYFIVARHKLTVQAGDLLYRWQTEVARIVNQCLTGVLPVHVAIFGVDLMRSTQAVSRPCCKLHNAARRRLFTCTAGWSCTAGPVPHGSTSCAATSSLSTLRRTLAVSTAEPAAPHKGSGDFSACGTAAARSASRSGRLVQLWHLRCRR